MSDFFATPWSVAYQSPLSRNSPGKNTGVGCHSLLEWIFPTLGWNLGLPHQRWTPYHLKPPGKPKMHRGASLVAQSLRIRLPCRRHEVDPWSGKIPHVLEQLSMCTIPRQIIFKMEKFKIDNFKSNKRKTASYIQRVYEF